MWPFSSSKKVQLEHPGTITTSSQLAEFMSLAPSEIGRYDYKHNLEDGFVANVIVAYCLDLLATAMGSIQLQVVDSQERPVSRNNTPGYQVQRLLKRPSPELTYKDLVRQILYYKKLAGEYFILRGPTNELVKQGQGELEFLDPRWMTWEPEEQQWRYQYKMKNGQTRIEIYPKWGPEARLLHRKLFDPNTERGMARLSHAWRSVRTFNEGTVWNWSLLKNKAAPNLVVHFDVSKTDMGDDVYQAYKKKFEQFVGSQNAGRTMIVSSPGDMKISELGKTPKDMDFANLHDTAAKEIALSLGVDPIFLGLKGDSTFSNKEAAIQSFYTHTIIPLLEEVAEDIEFWMKAIIPGDWRIKLILDNVPALEPQRTLQWERARGAADILTRNERRALVGFPPIEGGDVITTDVVAPKQPTKDGDHKDENAPSAPSAPKAPDGA